LALRERPDGHTVRSAYNDQKKSARRRGIDALSRLVALPRPSKKKRARRSADNQAKERHMSFKKQERHCAKKKGPGVGAPGEGWGTRESPPTTSQSRCK